MKTTYSKLLISAAMILSLSGIAGGTAHAAGVVNSGPSTSSSNSQVTMTATVPSVVVVSVDQASSDLTVSVSPSAIDSTANVSSTDFQIIGNVIVNSASANVNCTVSATTLNLTNGSDSITAKLTGTIGGKAISTSNFTPTFSSKKAAINIAGDLDESTITSSKAPGSYNGTLTITASLL